VTRDISMIMLLCTSCGGVVATSRASVEEASSGGNDAVAAADAPDEADTPTGPARDTAMDDAPDDTPDSQTIADPLSPCSVSRDVLYLEERSSPGPMGLRQGTVTNLNANWFVDLQPELNVHAGTGNSLQISDPKGLPPAPGTYPQSPSGLDTYLSTLAVGGESCVVASGVLTIVDLQYVWRDGSSRGDVTSLALWFDVICGNSGNTVRGCVRYSP
jgi:hypothetical protein